MLFQMLKQFFTGEPEPNHFGMGMTFGQIVASDDNFCVANGTFCLIDMQYGEFDASRYSKHESVVMLVWHSAGIIGNGGFDYLFQGPWQGDADYVATIEAHRRIGLAKSADAFAAAINQFPGSAMPSDPDERYRAYITTDEDIRNSIDALYYEDSDDHRERAVADFVRQYKDQFRHLHKLR